MRKDTWKQPNPRLQLISILNGVRGTLSNLQEGVVPLNLIRQRLEAMDSSLEEVFEILKIMNDDKWPEPRFWVKNEKTERGMYPVIDIDLIVAEFTSHEEANNYAAMKNERFYKELSNQDNKRIQNY